MEDCVIRATAGDGAVRAFAAVTTNVVETARRLHGLSPVASAALGRTLTAGVLMSRMLKGERDTTTIQIKGEGPLGGIVVVTDAEARVRGYVNNPDVDLPLNEAGKLDVASAVGKDGYLNIIKDLGLREPYVGYVRLESGEIGDDIAYYFAFSEQVPSVVALGVLVDTDESILTAGGYIIQLMPDTPDAMITYLEERIKELPSVSAMLFSGLDAEGMLREILEGMNFKVTDKAPCSFTCNCSRERMERNLISLGRHDLEEILQDGKGAELQCHFCNSRYMISDQELRDLLIAAQEK